jgi:hypothetical protein
MINMSASAHGLCEFIGRLQHRSRVSAAIVRGRRIIAEECWAAATSATDFVTLYVSAGYGDRAEDQDHGVQSVAERRQIM